MTNYIDAEELKQKIESLKKVYNNSNRVIHGVSDAFRQDGRVAMCDDIISEIESLQQEQPNADLEAEVKEMIYDSFYDLGGVAIQGATKYITVEDVADLARHFAEWGTIHPNAIQSLQQEQLEEDLEAEVERWWNERYAKLKKDYKFDSTSGHYLDNEGIIDLARHFYELGLNTREK